MMDVEKNNNHNTTNTSSCVIVGGGLAGLATAVALQSTTTTDVMVLEAQSERDFYDVNQGAAVQLGANGFKALEMICNNGGNNQQQKELLIEEIMRHGHVLTHIGIILPNQQSVVVIPDTSTADTGYPQVLIRWGILRQILQQQLPKSCIRTGVQVAGYQWQNNSVVPTDEHGKPILVSSNNHHHPSLLVVADGIDTPFYNDILGDSSGQHSIVDNGRVNIKAVVNKSLEYGNFFNAAMPSSSIPQGTALTYHAPDGSVACFAGSAGPNHTYWAISIVVNNNNVQDLETTGETLKQHVLQTIHALNSPQQCQFVTDLIQATPAETIYVQRSRQFDEIPPQFHYNNNHQMVVTVGDAAHAMSPSYGQAANFGFEDAATLRYCLQHQLPLESYSQIRVPRCQTMHGKSSERIAKHTKGESTQDLFKWIGSWQPVPPNTKISIDETTDSPSPQPHSDEVMQVVA